MGERLTDRMRAVLRGFLTEYGLALQSATAKQTHLHQEITALREELRRNMPDNPATAGFKIYSQTDEDGILQEIFRRIGAGERTFLEIGCSDGKENNTHALLLQGWRGTWVDGSTTKIASIGESIPLETKRLRILCTYVTRENVAALVTETQQRYGVRELDLLSIDVDGNDLYLLQTVLAAATPRVIVIEYNSKFPPPLSITTDYNPTHAWRGDDYHGASLQALADAAAGYRLVACNLSGANAFFVRDDLAQPFTDYGIARLYQPPRHHLIHARFGEPASLGFLRDALRRD